MSDEGFAERKDETDPGGDYELYEDSENLRPQGPPRRRESALTELLPVRLSPELMTRLRRRAQGADRSVSWVVRRAIEDHLESNDEESPR